MKHRNKNRSSPFPGRMLQEVTKPGFSFCCVIFVFSYFVCLGIFGLLLFYFVGTSAVDCLNIMFQEGC